MNQKCSLIVLLLSLSFNLNAQNELENFSGIQIKNFIYLTFTLKAGITCNGLVIERSSDSTGFTEVGNIAGVCGSSSSSETYTFEDYSPLKNGPNYYRLNLGNFGYSKSIVVNFFSFQEEGVFVYPNPVVSQSTFYFKNPEREDHTLFIYDEKGKIKKTIPFKDEIMLLKSEEFNKGYFYYQLINDKTQKKVASGKILFL